MIDKEYKTDVALMTATNTEYKSLMFFHDWEHFQLDGDEQLYDRTTFERDGNTFSIVHAKQAEMGMTAAASTAMKLIYEFRPRYIIMVGIAAGVAQEGVAEQMYGDVVVPDVVWNYAAGKFVSPDNADIAYGEVGFLPRSTFASIPEDLVKIVEGAAKSPENQCHVHIGPMACGSSVVANPKILEMQIHSQLNTTAGLDMESYAVVYAALHATTPRPSPLIVKSVCDFANSQKSDDFQRFAAYTACDFAKFLYEKYLPFD